MDDILRCLIGKYVCRFICPYVSDDHMHICMERVKSQMFLISLPLEWFLDFHINLPGELQYRRDLIVDVGEFNSLNQKLAPKPIVNVDPFSEWASTIRETATAICESFLLKKKMRL